MGKGDWTLATSPLTHQNWLNGLPALSRKGRGRNNDRRKGGVATNALRSPESYAR